MASFRDTLKADICSALPRTDSETRRQLLDVILEEVSAVEELIYLKVEDLDPPLKKIRARQLIAFFEGKYGQARAAPDSLYAGQQHRPTSPSLERVEGWLKNNPPVEDLDPPTDDSLSNVAVHTIPTTMVSADAKTVSQKSSVQPGIAEGETSSTGSSESDTADKFLDAEASMTPGIMRSKERKRTSFRVCSIDPLLSDCVQMAPPVTVVFYMMLPRGCKNVHLCLHTPQSALAIRVPMDERPHEESKGHIWTCQTDISWNKVGYHYYTEGEKIDFVYKELNVHEGAAEAGGTGMFCFDQAITTSRSSIPVLGYVYNVITRAHKKDHTKIVDGLLTCIDWANVDQWHKQLSDLHPKLTPDQKGILKQTMVPKVTEKINTLQNHWVSKEQRVRTALALTSLDRQQISEVLNDEQTDIVLRALEIKSPQEASAVSNIRNRTFFNNLGVFLEHQTSTCPWNVTWVSCLPLLRLLDPDHEGDQEMPQWWKEKFEGITKIAFDGKSPVDVLEKIRPILPADRPTTLALLSLLAVNQISILYEGGDITPDIVLDYIALTFPDQMINSLQREIQKLFDAAMKKLAGPPRLKGLTRRLRTTLEHCKGRMKQWPAGKDDCLSSTVLISDFASKMVHESKGSTARRIFDDMVTLGIFPHLKYSHSLSNTIRKINAVWTAEFSEMAQIDAVIIDSLHDILMKSQPLRLISEYGQWKDKDGVHDNLLNIFRECVKLKIKEGLQDSTEEWSLSLFESQYYSGATSDIYSEIFLESWEDQDSLNHLLTWPHIPHFLDKASEGPCNEKLEQVSRHIVDEVTDGSITYGDMQLVLHENDLFSRITQSTSVVSSERLQFILESRRQQLDKLDEFKLGLTAFKDRCHMASYDAVECLHIAPELIMDQSLNDLFEAPSLRDVDNEADWESNIRPFKVPAEVIKTFPTLRELEGRRAFDQVFEETITESENDINSMNLTEFTEHIVARSLQQWDQVCQKMKDASIKLDIVKAFFEELDDDDIRAELIYICKEEAVIIERLKQVLLYNRILQLDRQTETLRKVQRAYKKQLTGNFELVAKRDQKDATLASITDETEQIVKGVGELNDEKLEWLDTYSEAHPLVTWLQEKLPTQKEVMVLLDMQFFSANDHSGLELTKATCLRDIADVFGPLIYGLPPKAGLKELLEKFEEIWEKNGQEKNWPKKLIDLSNDLDWLKTLNTRQSDAGRDALCRVEDINSRGIYIVGTPEDGNNVPARDLDQMITVKVPKEKAKPEEKDETYPYSELQNLQSTLVLVAGQNEESIQNVQRFSEIMNAVRGVAETFCKLCDNGNILFEDWSSKFYCNKDVTVNTHVNFGLADGILGGTKEEGKMLDHIKQVHSFMKGCLDDWAEHIREQRKQFPVLNSFTTKQIVILRRELSKITEHGPEGIPDKIFPLLQVVLPRCTRDELKEAWVETVQEIMKSAQQTVPLKKDQPKEEDEEVIEILEERGFHREQILRAIRESGSESGSHDPTELMAWCWKAENSAEEKGIVDSSAIQMEETHGTVMADIIKQVEEESKVLKERLRSLWKTYLCTNTSKSMKDYLSVVHLGHMLTFLHGKRTEKTVKRRFPAFLHKGHPNLILCHKANIWTKILSIYMYDEHLPLPTRDEILLCTPETSVEDVQLLLMRAAHDDDKIFMLVNIDQLSYKVAQQVEGDMQKILQGCPDYRLVVMCSREGQEKSVLVPALFGNRIESTLDSTKDQIRSYIRGHLAAQDSTEKTSVTIVESHRAGVGKTLWIRKKQSACADGRFMCVPLHGKVLNIPAMVDRMCENMLPPESNDRSFYHIDIPHEMNIGVDQLLFELVILRSLSDPKGYLWARSERDLYAIEVMPLQRWEVESGVTGEERKQPVHHMLELLPTVTCSAPEECLKIMKARAEGAMKEGNREILQQSENAILMDEGCFRSDPIQRVYQMLLHLKDRKDLRGFKLTGVQGNMIDCLETLLGYSDIDNPSWAELNYFVEFLNKHWCQYEESLKNTGGVKEGRALAIGTSGRKSHSPESAEEKRRLTKLPSFNEFVVRVMLKMSTDFVGRSLQIADEIATHSDTGDENTEWETVERYDLKRKWKSSANPYVFFNPDGHTLTFLGYYVEKETMNLLDPQTKECLVEKIMDPVLYDSLKASGVKLKEDLNSLTRNQQLQKLCTVIGVGHHDPDPNYVLTSDNIKKMLAIYMRFKCQIPVIVMGESGCGKTYLVNFLCRLQKPQGPEAADIKNRFVLKIHGNVKQEEMIQKIKEAERAAKENHARYPGLFTVVFLDEVNTTEALSLVKEILCDHTINGEPLDMESGLRFVAACNPYKKHSKEMIKKMEEGGLGYHVLSDKASDRFGCIPMRHLVYRVEPLPQSLLPLVWDFGQLDDDTEKLYIKKIVQKHFHGNTNFNKEQQSTISEILHASQCYMRSRKDECSHVSLRDPERVLVVMDWFYKKRSKLFTHTRACDDEKTWAIIMALGVCYHAALGTAREEYRNHIVRHFKEPLYLPDNGQVIADIIHKCQDLFVNKLDLEPTIAKNEALKENIFMEVVCMELRIPLFIVGKPGSSKTLSRQILANKMKGPSSTLDLFKSLKKVQMTVYQCSPLSTVSGIQGTFDACAATQQKNNLNEFVSVVVLDEVGLAEDTPEMPLKTLHHLLEHDRDEEEFTEPHKRVGFLGLSNWSLDPAKNNRALMVRRLTPDEGALKDTALAICHSRKKKQHLTGILNVIAGGYHKLYEDMVKGETQKEFFGLRDFYSVVKVLYAFTEKHNRKPEPNEVRHAILRNFGGLLNFNPMTFFPGIASQLQVESQRQESTTDLIAENLNKIQLKMENRHLLLLTENQAALSIIQEHFEVLRDAVIIFGSSFPDDLDFTKLCRAINRVKQCMESGKTVILLNQQPIFESLYDALNQYYTYFGGERHVDIGLGSQRMKCKVHEDFKLVVVADSDTVHKEFPIPLINRFEKHYLATSTILNKAQRTVIKQLTRWIKDFANKHYTHRGKRGHELTIKPEDFFIGYHKEAPAAIVLQVCKELGEEEGDKEWRDKVLEDCKRRLLQCATPESIVLVEETCLEDETETIRNIYLNEQKHEGLSEFLRARVSGNQQHEDTFIQVTTHSQLLSKEKVETLRSDLQVQADSVSIQAFATGHEFSEVIRSFYHRDSDTEDDLFILQCDSGNDHQDLLACCRYIITDEHKKLKDADSPTGTTRARKHVVLVVQLPRLAGGCFTGFQMQPWECVHIDELYSDHQMPPIHSLLKGPVSAVLRPPDMEPEVTDGELEVISTAVFEKFFEYCIIPAMSILKDEGEEGGDTLDNKHANTRRVEKLNNLLKDLCDSDRNDFLSMMRMRIYLLQCDRQHNYKDEENPSAWLSKVATTSREMKMLTFRSQVREYIQKKMTGLIAGIIAFADSNNNLDILLKDNEPWKKQMWLRMMNNEQAIHLSIEEDLGQSEPQEIPVKSHGANGLTRASHLPFSWKIYKLINDYIKAMNKDPLTAALEAPDKLQQKDMWTILIETLNDENDSEVVRKRVLESYLPDFVDMVYKPTKEAKGDECQMVCKEITRQFILLVDKKKHDIMPDHYIPLIHAAYSQIKPRIDFYSQMVQLCPAITDSMTQKGQPEAQSDLTLDLQAVKHAVALMQPTVKTKSKSEVSKSWYEKTGKVAPLINQALQQNAESQGQSAQIRDLSDDWKRIITVRMFASEVFPPKSDKSDMQVYCSLILYALQKNMTPLQTLKEVDETFKRIFSMQKKELLKSNVYKKCPACKKEISEMYLLPCGHESCASCTDQQRQAEHINCVQCKVKHVSSITFEKLVSSGEQKLRSFKNSCYFFRLELVKCLCQSEDGDLIDQLLKNISDPPAADADPAGDQRIRVVLLQLLLNKCESKVQEHLDEVFKKQERISGHLLDLAILYIQCMEDNNPLAKTSDNLDAVRPIAAMLNGTLKAFHSTGFNTDRLNAIADMRFCLSQAANWLNKLYINAANADLKFFTEDLLPVVREVCRELTWARKFLIKVLVRRFTLKLPSEQSGEKEGESEVNIKDRLQKVKSVLTEVLTDGTLEITELQQMMEETENDSQDTQDPFNMAVMWRYRLQVNFKTATERLTKLRRMKQGEPDRHELLYYFMQYEPTIREVQHLPGIIKFQQLLLQHYNYKITQKQADVIPISQFLNARDREGDKECLELFEDCQRVWNIQEQGKTTEGTNQTLERCTPVSSFLPKLDVLNRLVHIHNNLMERIMPENINKGAEASSSKAQPSDHFSLGPDVHLLDVKPTHLVTYDPDKDLLPLVTANCSSSLKVGQGTHVEYDFDKLESQLAQRLFEGKSKIINTGTTMVFSDNLTTVHKLENLEKRIPQEPFTPAMEIELREDTRVAQDVYDLVENLDMAISFLHTVGGDRDRSLDDFMTKDLGMDPAPLPRMTKEHCKFKNMRALWLMMGNEREKHAAQLGAIPFSTLTEERYDTYREPLEKEQLEQLRKSLKHVKLDRLLMELFTCIALIIIKDEVNPKNTLTDHLTERDIAVEALQLPDDVDVLRVSQCMYTWRAVYDYSSSLNNGEPSVKPHT